MEINKGKLSWLEELFGVNPSDLDEETLELAQKLGPGGVLHLKDSVQELIDSGEQIRFIRGRVTTGNDRQGLIGQIRRLRETGGKWAPGQVEIGDGPENWIENDIGYLEDD